MYQHGRASHSAAVNARVSNIRRNGEEPLIRAIAYFYEEVDALNFESELISNSAGLLNRAKNPQKPGVVSLLDVFSRAGSASRRELSVAKSLCAVGSSKYPNLSDLYNKIAESISKVEANRYAAT